MKEFPKNLICFSHLRWDFVYQRPQHLMTRLSKSLYVYYFEEPIFDATDEAFYQSISRSEQLWTIVPHLPNGLSAPQVVKQMNMLLHSLLKSESQNEYCFWYYTPMAYEFTASFSPAFTVYDCMDELSAFKFAPPQLRELEQQLMLNADVVFTGGQTLYEAKKSQHANIFPFPSSIDKEHFATARIIQNQPVDQSNINGTKLGFYGVIDERFDVDLIAGIADLRPDWNIILIGPVVKIDPAILPQKHNIHYLGQRSYADLPGYLSGWDIALIPFLLNESTKFISPTKTPEYLAAGVPVVSTPITDVVKAYGINNLVSIGSNAMDFVKAVEEILASPDLADWLKKSDTFLADNSWEGTYLNMFDIMQNTFSKSGTISIAS